MRRALISLLALVACSNPSEQPAAPEDAATHALEELAALGYVSFDEGAVEAHAATGEPHSAPFVYADDRRTIRRVANDGAVLASWTTPQFDQVEFAEPLSDGGVVCVSVDQGIVRLDAESRPLWRFREPAHHEVALRPGGGFVVPVWREVNHRGRRVRFDELVFLDAEGSVERRWWTWDHRELLADHHEPLPLDAAPVATTPSDTIYDQYHVNTIVVLRENQLGLGEPAESLLVCARNADLVFVLDVENDRILWSFGPGELDFPHTPTPVAGGVLIFDNGYHRGWSRLVEVDVKTRRIRWEWTAPTRAEFFSKTRGSAQRLSNGHTFVCESERGRLFELSPSGEVVWSWVNPEMRSGKRRRIYRARRSVSLEGR